MCWGKWTIGFEAYAERCAEYPPERVAKICGIDAQLIIDVARFFGKAERAVLQWGVAMDHNAEGFLTGMACMDLFALTGNLEKPGTMVSANSYFGISETWMPAPDVDRHLITDEQQQNS